MAASGFAAIGARQVWKFFHKHIIRGGWGVGTLATMEDPDTEECDTETAEYLAWLHSISLGVEPWT